MKLVITDMDGTLLNEHKQVPQSFFDLMDKLKGQDIKFAIASGRQYGVLIKDFKEYYKDMIIIADNGAAVYDGDTLIYEDSLTKEQVHRVQNECVKYPNLSLVYSGLKTSFYDVNNEEIVYNAKIYYHEYGNYEDADDMLKHDKILKVAAYDLTHNAETNYIPLSFMNDDMDMAVSGNCWVDFNPKGVNKGKALRIIKEKYHIQDTDVYAFGDYNNDLPMMKEAYHSHAMANATPEMKTAARYIIGSNKEEAVVRELEKLFLK